VGADQRIETWAAVVAHLRERHGAGAAALERLEVTVTASSGRSIAVTVEPTSAFEQPWIELRTVVGAAAYVPPPLTLARNLNLPVGAAYFDDHLLGMRQLLLLAGLTTAELDDALASLAEVSDEAAESDRVREATDGRGRATPWADWPTLAGTSREP
jgi:hypothetical protein